MTSEACRLVRALDGGPSDGVAEMAREFEAAGDHRMKFALEDPEGFFAHLERFESGVDLPPDRVRQTQFWLMCGDRMIGASRLRYRLIPFLERDGGHIGYEIRPSERRKGFGTEILRLTLLEAAAVGIHRVLLTTDPTNLASIRIIERHGGVFAGTSTSPESGERLNRYWIDN